MWLQNYNVYKSNFVVDNLHLLLFSLVALSRRLVLEFFSNKQYFGHSLLSEADTSLLAASGATLHRRRGGSLWPFSLPGSIVAIVFLILAAYLFARVVTRHTIKHSLLLLFPYTGYAVAFILKFRSRRRGQRSHTPGPGPGPGQGQGLGLGLGGAHLVPSENMFIGQVRDAICTIFETSCIAALLPFVLLQNEYLFFEKRQCVTLLLFVALSCAVILSCRVISTDFYERFMRARYLGFWRLKSATLPDEATPPPQWSPSHVYPAGFEVSHNSAVFIAGGDTNTAEPGRARQQLFHALYAYPERAHGWLIGVQVAISVSLLLLVVRTSRDWSIYATILLFNYYILWLCIWTRRLNLRHLAARISPPTTNAATTVIKQKKPKTD